jgi:hypothetical protein
MMISRIEPRPSLEEAAVIELALRAFAGAGERAPSKWGLANRADLKVGCYKQASCYSSETPKGHPSWASVARKEATAQVV